MGELENARLSNHNDRMKVALEQAIDHLVRLDAFVEGQGYRPTIRGTVALGRAALGDSPENVVLRKRPTAFAIEGGGRLSIFLDEQEAAQKADALGVEYHGLYMRSDAG